MEDNAGKIQLSLTDVLKAKVTPTKRSVARIKKKEDFCEILSSLKYCNDRAYVMKADIAVDFTTYEEPFYTCIDNLMEMAFPKKKLQLINWWVYDKWYHPEGVLEIVEEDSGREIPTDTPEDLWDFLQTL